MLSVAVTHSRKEVKLAAFGPPYCKMTALSCFCTCSNSQHALFRLFQLRLEVQQIGHTVTLSDSQVLVQAVKLTLGNRLAGKLVGGKCGTGHVLLSVQGTLTIERLGVHSQRQRAFSSSSRGHSVQAAKGIQFKQQKAFSSSSKGHSVQAAG